LPSTHSVSSSTLHPHPLARARIEPAQLRGRQRLQFALWKRRGCHNHRRHQKAGTPGQVGLPKNRRQPKDPVTYRIDKCRLCGIDPESAALVIADCMALDYNRLETPKVTHLTQPYAWDLSKLLKFLEPLEDMKENTEAPARPITLKARNRRRTTLLDSTALPSLYPPSPSWGVMAN